jgi:predicted NAD/FAD-dependent oxidoreductase
MIKPNSSPVDILIIGSGLAGLSAAKKLSSKGLNVVVIDKGRGVGGRLAARRIGDAVFDNGAQFFTARSKEFQACVNQWVKAGVAEAVVQKLPRTTQWSPPLSRCANHGIHC